MIILVDISGTELRPGDIRPSTQITIDNINKSIFVAFYDADEYYIIKSVYTKQHVYGKIDDLIELVNFIIARTINK